jgi:cytochrome b
MPMRVFHSLMAFSFTGAYLTAEIERLRWVHISLGYTLFGLVVFRLIWGFLGPRQSRLAGTWRKLTAIQNFRQLMNASMAATALLTLCVAFFITASGYVFYIEMAGEWMEEIHEFFANFMLVLVLVHLSLIGILMATQNSQAIRPMWSGRKAGLGPHLAKSNHVIVATLLSLCVIAFLWFQFTAK